MRKLDKGFLLQNWSEDQEKVQAEGGPDKKEYIK